VNGDILYIIAAGSEVDNREEGRGGGKERKVHHIDKTLEGTTQTRKHTHRPTYINRQPCTPTHTHPSDTHT